MNNLFKSVINTKTKEKVILNLIKKGYSTRVELSKNIGVTTATLTKVSKELIRDNILEESGEIEDGKVGRKQRALKLKGDFCYSIGIDISLNFARIIVLNLALEIVYEKSWSYDNFDETILDKLTKELIKEIKKIGSDKILGIGLLLQGIIDGEESMILPIKDVKRRLEKSSKMDIILLNNIRGLAIVENFYETNKDNFLLVKYGPGVGGVFSIDGKVVEGYRGRAGEIGHIMWNKDSKNKCPVCGKTGCLESEIHFKNLSKDNSLYSENFHEDFVEKNKDTLKKYVKELASAISMCIDILDPSQVLVAGRIFDDMEIFSILQNTVRKNTKDFCNNNICKVSNYDEKTRKAPAIIVFTKKFKLNKLH